METKKSLITYKSLFISDVHLGTKGCQADKLLEFFKYSRSENLYLVGDIIDGWRFKRGKSWNEEATNIIQILLRKAKKSKTCTYLIGNHDDFLRDYKNSMVEKIHLTDSTVHVGKDGKRYLVVHGDLFDSVTRYSKLFALFADKMYSFLIYLNHFFNYFRRRFLNGKYWSLSAYIKKKSKDAINFIFEFEKAITTYAKQKQFNGVICGHIHTPEIKKVDETFYYNCGDWVESHTALVENHDGTFEIINWADMASNNEFEEKKNIKRKVA